MSFSPNSRICRLESLNKFGCTVTCFVAYRLPPEVSIRWRCKFSNSCGLFSSLTPHFRVARCLYIYLLVSFCTHHVETWSMRTVITLSSTATASRLLTSRWCSFRVWVVACLAAVEIVMRRIVLLGTEDIRRACMEKAIYLLACVNALWPAAAQGGCLPQSAGTTAYSFTKRTQRRREKLMTFSLHAILATDSPMSANKAKTIALMAK